MFNGEIIKSNEENNQFVKLMSMSQFSLIIDFFVGQLIAGQAKKPLLCKKG